MELKENELFNTFVKYCVGKGIEATPERINITIKYLLKNKFIESDIKLALNKLFGESPFFPDASMIIKAIRPSNEAIGDRAQEVVGEIMGALANYNPHTSEKLSDEAEATIERFGGWSVITALSYPQLNTSRAQLREIAKSSIRIASQNNKQIGKSGGALMPISELIK